MRFSHFVVGATALAVVARADEGEKPKNFEDVIGINKHLTKFRDTLSQSAGDLYSLISLTPGLTVLAPSNAAYDKLTFSPLKAVFDANDTAGIRNILQYHILDGVHSKKDFHTTPQFPLTFLTDLAVEKVKDGQKVEAVGQNGGGLVFISGLGGRTSVQEADLRYSNGIIQVIDSFLVPPQPLSNTSIAFNVSAMAGAVTKAKLNHAFDTTRDLTIFAPNNDAFQQIGSGLVNMSVDELSHMMRYHVVNSTVAYSSSPSLQNGTVLRSVQGGNLTIRSAGNSLYVNSAQLLQQDLLLSNGVLHIIDNVLDYRSPSVTPNPTMPSQTAVVQGSSIDDVPFTTDLPVTTTTDSSSSASTSTTDPSATTDGSGASSAPTGRATATSTKKSDASLNFLSSSSSLLLGLALMFFYRC